MVHAARDCALIWNLPGCAAYLMDVMLTPEAVAKMTEAQQALYHARSVWSVGTTAIAVWFGAAGCLVLLIAVGLVLLARKAAALGWAA